MAQLRFPEQDQNNVNPKTMKKILHLNLITLFVIALVMTNGCKKEGPPGPAGNANVTATTFSASSWSWSSPYYYANFNVPDLTSSNINTAAVMVYFSTTGGTWIAVPYTQYTSAYDYHMGFNTSAGTVQVTWVYDSSLSNGSDPNAFYSTTVQYKIVVIPPSARQANPNVNLKDYNAVKAAFQLQN
jgi:hypothetical protein